MFALLNVFIGDDFGGVLVGIPGPVALGEEALGELLIVARFRHPELHHHIVDASFGTCFFGIASTVQDNIIFRGSAEIGGIRDIGRSSDIS